MEEHQEAMPLDDDPGAGGDADHMENVAPAQPDGQQRARPARRSRGLKGMLDDLLKPPAPVSRADAEREAARQIEEAATPAMERLVFSVPGAASPEDALAQLEENRPAREVPSEPAPIEGLPTAEVAHTIALYQVRHHLESYKHPTAHERELATRLKVRTGVASGNGGA